MTQQLLTPHQGQYLALHRPPHPLAGEGGRGAGFVALQQDVETRKAVLLRKINQSNSGYFEQEIQKLDAWAGDLKLALEEVQLQQQLEERALFTIERELL